MKMSAIKYTGLLLLTTFLMGIAFPVGKIGLEFAPPFLLMGLRFVIAGALLALLTARKRQPKGARQWLQAAALGLFQSAGVMFTFGLHLEIEPGTFICFAGAVCFTIATLILNRIGPAFDLKVLAAYQMMAGGIALLVLSGVTEDLYFSVNVTSILVLLWLVVMCSIVQFSVWFYLLQNSDPARTSAFLFLVPLFGVLTSWMLLGERVTWHVYAGGAMICIGIFMVNWRRTS
ncbi:DMT family transporter [Paenibacillus sp. DYY-L-2]|uniref:DMT family transporter n=1 Tax=Paenibacillus sp. DYY-L-2 TaxID=3447013 RepID=UPI003F503196